MKLILLPGLDGTGELFSPFIKELPATIEVEVIAYSAQQRLNYHQLVSYVKERLPKEEFILLAESFSGPIAYEIVRCGHHALKGVVFVTTFLRPPRAKLLQWVRFLPLGWIFALPLPTFMIKKLLLGSQIDHQTIALFKETLKKVDPNVIAFRVREIANLNLEYQAITTPAIYIQATDDLLVPLNMVDKFEECFANITIYKVEGSHLILQSKPQMCATLIVKLFQ